MLAASIGRHAQRDPGRIALVQDDQRWSYAGFAAAIARTRGQLAGLDLRPGSAAVVATRNAAQAWIQGIALRSLGIVTVPVPAGAGGIGGLRLGSIESLVVSEREHRAEIEATAAQRGWRCVTLPLSPPDTGASAPEPISADLQLQWCAGHVLMTSGTTGSFKMLMRDPLLEHEAVPLTLDALGIDSECVLFASDFPMLTAGGYRWPLYAWTAGATVVFHQGHEGLKALLSSGASMALTTPGTLGLWLRQPDSGLPRLESLRLMVTGGSLPLALAEAARTRIAPRVYSLLASTETSTLALTLFETADDLRLHRLIPQREVQVMDEDGNGLAHGRVGLLRIRTSEGLDSYLGDPEATRRFFRDGWFYPGDLASILPGDCLQLHGRVTDVINVQGHKVATGPLEQQLQDRFRAEAVCLLSAPGASGEEEMHVVIQPRDPLRKQDLELTGQELARVYGLVRFHLVEQLPRNHMGKVQRLQLREQLFGG